MTSELVECEVDLRVGGGYRLVQRAPDGLRFSFHGERIFPEPMDLEPVSTTAFSRGAVAHVCRPTASVKAA